MRQSTLHKKNTKNKISFTISISVPNSVSLLSLIENLFKFSEIDRKSITDLLELAMQFPYVTQTLIDQWADSLDLTLLLHKVQEISHFLLNLM